MATTRARRSSSATPRRRTRAAPKSTWTQSFRVPPHVARSLIGLTLLVVGAVTLIALLFPQAGVLNRYVSDILRRDSNS